ncbi:ATP-binding cassette domain-containing protein [Polaromonas sp. YR568]|uniref:ABC transporter ATP-binding protein n=1 Tax=Polaromonas sp. YR568 TaxID=1855301 RepID=UPI0031381F6A
MTQPDPTDRQSLPSPRAAASPMVLQAEGLRFCYPERELFAGLSVAISPGVTFVHGGDGRGKTTLLRLLAGQLPAAAGSLKINSVSLQDQAAAYRQQVFWTEPRTEAFDQMTPAHYFDVQRRAYAGFDDGVLATCVDGLALAPELTKQLFMLSTGSKRKVWLAAAFASGAALTLLDMPFAALDKASIGFVLALLEDAAAHPLRAFVVADYAAPAGVPLAGVIDLGD